MALSKVIINYILLLPVLKYSFDRYKFIKILKYINTSKFK